MPDLVTILMEAPVAASQVRGVVAAIDLEFLHIVLAYRQPHATAIARGLATVDRYAVSSAIAAVERQSALWAFA